jgi:hypothetical protein
MKTKFYFFNRFGDCPGITASKNAVLPDGDFKITEYVFQRFGYVSLWFIDGDNFSANERERAYEQFLDGAKAESTQ